MNEEVFSNPVIKKRKKSGNFAIFVLSILLVISLLGSYYFYTKYSAIKNNADILSQKEINSVLKDVSKLMFLPTDEEPSMATIIDKNQLIDQPFFTEAKNGDKLLIFGKSSQAIIYRPSDNKIIKVGPIFLNQSNQNTGSQSDTADNSLSSDVSDLSFKVAYYNGTNTDNLSAQTESAIKLKYPNSQTTILKNANQTDYKSSIVVDISGVYTQEISNIANFLNASVQGLPEGEEIPEADILIISGN
ncbi:MAG: hypothetical protein A2493_00940 [Candidatus Magasanikbacteria bacterium RIFOXYC12_FULL_33_11]|uniref:LytR/CpsA/Psr regulator C-terminal domain-containing protein n=1 Tax=Candidatus Magasanikbacteria bacterium RIFOXYC12_FULL_33_11 TaxID=1798701 RepID=A0A1F6NRK5_9BACT|nr:MAG: hypothetical protein A2493_00940 [Candidatus Magasanikbacteria bacterium RIFOXYC12_FULL_33_11]